MELKITGLKIDGIKKPPVPKANLKAIKAEQEEDPEKKKRLQEEVRGDDHTGAEHGEGEKKEKEHKKKQKKAKGGAADTSGMVSGTGNGGE